MANNKIELSKQKPDFWGCGGGLKATE